MTLPTPSKNLTALSFKLAGALAIIYFLLRTFNPPNFGSLIDTRGYNSLDIPWWVPVWPIDSVFARQSAYGVGSPLLIASLAFTLLGVWGLYQYTKDKKSSDNRSVIWLALVSTGLMVVTSLVFGLLAFPNLVTTEVLNISISWSVALVVLFTAVAIVATVSFIALIANMIRQRQMALWAAILMALGILIVDINWFTLVRDVHGGWGALSALIFLLGIGWGIGLWHMSYMVRRTKSVENKWPRLSSWRKAGIAGAGVVALWIVLVVGVFAWDAQGTVDLCRGSQEVIPVDGETSRVVYSNDLYSFSYTKSAAMPWQSSRAKATEENKYNCAMATAAVPDWVHNRAWGYVPISHFWLEQQLAPQVMEPHAALRVFVREAEFASVDEMQAEFERRREAERERNKSGEHYSNFYLEAEFSRKQVDGHEALVTSRIFNQTRSNSYGQTVQMIEGEEEYLIYWNIWAETAEGRDAYLAEHRDELEAMVESFKFK